MTLLDYYRKVMGDEMAEALIFAFRLAEECARARYERE